MEQSDEYWKHKYLSHLDKLEQAEANWRELEELLRLGMNRVALAAQGVDSGLDRHLLNLRKSIRSGNYNGLELIVDKISHTVKKLDEQRNSEHPNLNDPNVLIAELVNNVAFPKKFKKRIKGLLKNLNNDKDNINIADHAKSLGEIINEAFGLLANSDNKSIDSDAGLLSRLFQRSEISSKQPAGGDDSSQNNDTHEPESLDLDTASTDSLVPLPEGASDGQRQHVGSSDNATRNISETGNVHSAKRLGEFCFHLLSSLAFPAEMQRAVHKLKMSVAQGVSSDNSLDVLQKITSLITETRVKVENEKNDLQAFLRQLTENLQEIDQHLAGAETDRQAVLKTSKTMGDAVEAQVNEIENSVHGAAELKELKVVVNNKLGAIRKNLYLHQQDQSRHQKKLENALKMSNARLAELETESQSLREKLSHEHSQAIHDILTGLYNRLAFEERMTQEFARWKRYQNALSLLIFDVDHFKRINDTYGHNAGDKALKIIAKSLQKNLRDADFLARYGGEEFVVIMPETDLKSAVAVGNKLRETVETCHFHYQNTKVNISVSCGVCQFKGQDTPESAFQRADSYLYAAKQLGRNRCYTKD